ANGQPGSAGPAGPQGPQGLAGGVLAASDYHCVIGTSFTSSLPVTFMLSGISFGSGISTVGQQFTSIILQPGIYQIHLDGFQFTSTLPGAAGSPIFATLDGGATSSALWVTTAGFSEGSSTPTVDIVGGDRLVQVSQPNASLALFLLTGGETFTAGPC